MSLTFHLQLSSATIHRCALSATVCEPRVGTMVEKELDELQTLEVVRVSAVISWMI